MRAHSLPRPIVALARPAQLSLALCGMLALALAGCGTTAATTAARPAGRPSPTATSAPSRPGPGLGLRSCPGPSAVAADTADGAVILTERTPDTVTPAPPPAYEASAHLGDRIQVRLRDGVRWGLLRSPGGVTPADPQGGHDASLGVCFWNFRASAVGDATIDFSGAPRCDTSGPCPQWALDEAFTVHIA